MLFKQTEWIRWNFVYIGQQVLKSHALRWINRRLSSAGGGLMIRYTASWTSFPYSSASQDIWYLSSDQLGPWFICRSFGGWQTTQLYRDEMRSHYKDRWQPTSIIECQQGFERCSFGKPPTSFGNAAVATRQWIIYVSRFWGFKKMLASTISKCRESSRKSAPPQMPFMSTKSWRKK